MKAINQAITDQCDLINMSLGESQPMKELRVISKSLMPELFVLLQMAMITEAVSFPANDSLSIAVSAMGRLNTFPPIALRVDQCRSLMVQIKLIL
ncbi:hypothetical protein CS542_05890 [Pedobacter sp. IW39]|nr:hypothetical protein CS542_05890 [Pedobacter sp. IW39]